MSSRGATWRGRHERRFDQKIRSRAGQRNRHLSDRHMKGKLADMPTEKFEHFVRKCKSKQAHKSYGAAYQAKLHYEGEYGVELSIYECPICNRYHLTSHPWDKPGDER